MKMTTASKDLLEMHFADLSSKPFFPKLVEFMLSGPVVAMVWEEKRAVKTDHKMLGGLTLLILFLEQFVEIIVLTLGETYVMDLTRWKQQKEIALRFKEGELNNYCCANNSWVYE